MKFIPARKANEMKTHRIIFTFSSDPEELIKLTFITNFDKLNDQESGESREKSFSDNFVRKVVAS